MGNSSHLNTVRVMAAHRVLPAVRGFTLIELMITVAIISILVAIALPAYQNSILKGRRAEGRAALLDLMQRQERLNTQTGEYEIIAANATSSTNFRIYSGDGPTNKAAYKLSSELCPGSTDRRSCVRLVATPMGADPDAGALWMLSTGAKGCNGNKQPAICW